MSSNLPWMWFAMRASGITDTLAEDEAFYQKLKGDMETGAKPIRVGQPNRTVVFQSLSDEDVQTWLFWMRRICDDTYKSAETREDMGVIGRCVKGTLPSIDEITQTGKAKRPRFHGVDGEDSEFYKPTKNGRELVSAGKPSGNQTQGGK